MSKEKGMNKVNVIIDNWPSKKHLLEYTPVYIAVIALFVSLYSVYLTRQAFIVSHRPYVWANNFAVIDPEKKSIIEKHNIIAFRILNAPAKITRLEVRINIENKKIPDYTDRNIVRYPDDEKTQWTYAYSDEDFKTAISNMSDVDKAKLSRIIEIEYSALDGGKIYHYKLHQSFDPAVQQWKYDSQEVN